MFKFDFMRFKYLLLIVSLLLSSMSYCQFSPDSISSLIFWLDNDNYDPTGTVDTVYDISNSGEHIHRVSASGIIIDSIPESNLKAYNFSNNSYETNASVHSTTSNYTVVCMFFPENVASGYITDSPTSRFIAPGFLGSNGLAYFAKNYTTDYIMNPNDLYEYTCIFDNVNGTSIEINDSLININSPSYSQKNLGSKLVVGSHNNNGSTFFDGYLVEYMIFNDVLPPLTIDSVHDYLFQRHKPDFSINNDIDIVIDSSTDCSSGMELFIPNGHFSNVLWSNGLTTDTILVNEPGVYYVEAEWYMGWKLYDTITISTEYQFKQDTLICDNDTLDWQTNLGLGYNFLWSDASTNSTNQFDTAGTYSVQISNNFGCSYIDTVVLSIDSFPTLTSLGPDKTICQGAAIGLTSNTNPTDYLWSTSDTIPQITINTPGQYWLQSSNVNGCINKDTINITLNGIAPNVGFTAQELCINEPVQFTDISTTSDGSNIIGWTWDFGDGSNSATANPQHQYNNDSTYIVTFTIQTDSNCENSITQNIVIHQKPTAGFFTTTNPICSGQTTSFSDNSFSTDGTIINWMWDFGDTGPNDTSSVQDPSYNFPVTSNYTVQHIVSTQYNCKDTVTNLVTVKASPVSSFTTTNQCLNNATAFTNTSQGNILSLIWDFGDATNSILNDPTHIYTTLNTYNVSLITTELNGCIDTVITPVIIYDNPVAKYTPLDFCVLANKQLYDSSTVATGTITDWSWDVINHTNQSTNQNPTFLFASADTGTYHLDLIVTSNFGCKDSIRDSIIVHPLPIPLFTFTPSIGAPPLLVSFNNLTSGTNTYFWNFGDNNNSTDISPTHNYLDSNIYIINLIATSSIGCIDSASQAIKVINPVLDVAVTNVSYSFNADNNFLNISAKLTNLGAFDVNSIDIVAETSDAGTILENWTGAFNIGNQMNYVFSSSFEINNGEVPDVICVRVKNPNGSIDDIPANNEFCVSLTKFLLISIYPNPASNILNLAYIIPTDGKVVINLHNAIGEQVTELIYDNASKGLNKNTVDLTSFRNGVYFVEILFDGNSIKEKIVIK